MIEQDDRDQEEEHDRLAGATVAVLVIGLALLNVCIALLWFLPW